MKRDRICFFAPMRDPTHLPHGAQTFRGLAIQTQLSVRGIARLLGVRVDTVIGWRKGKRIAPNSVLDELRAYILGMDIPNA